MLYRMGHSWHIVGIAEASNIDVDGCAGFICVRIVNKKSLELVRQPDDSVRPVIELGFLEVIGDPLYGRHACKKASSLSV